MEFKDYYTRKKSEIEIAKDEIINNFMIQNGMCDMYHLGMIAIIETIVNGVDKMICIALLTNLVESSDTSETIKKLSRDLIEKYSKETKSEL